MFFRLCKNDKRKNKSCLSEKEFKRDCMGKSSQKKFDDLLFFFLIFIKVRVEKSLSLPGKKNKNVYPQRYGQNRKKRFLDHFS